MKFAIPTDDNRHMAVHTGRAHGFLIYETKGTSVKHLDYRIVPEKFLNSEEKCYANHDDEEYSCSLSNCLLTITDPATLVNLLSDCDVLLTTSIGPKLGDVVTKNNIKIVYCKEEYADNAALEFVRDSLPASDKHLCVLTEDKLPNQF